MTRQEQLAADCAEARQRCEESLTRIRGHLQQRLADTAARDRALLSEILEGTNGQKS
jgi:hypothetical protein